MVEVREHEVLAREVHEPAIVTHEPVFMALGGEPLAHFGDLQVADGAEVVTLDEKIQRAVHRRIQLTHFEASFVTQRGVAGRVHVAIGLNAHGTVTRVRTPRTSRADSRTSHS